jgi:hypothetical protein
MKKLLILVAAFIVSAGVFAQDKTQDKKMGKMHDKGMMDHKMKDCVMMKDGAMMVMKNNETMKMDKDMTMSNGTMVMSDGSVKMKNGKTMMMKDGDCMYMDGKMSKMKMDKMMMKKKS